MTDPYLPAPREFRDLIPWADPYIASLLNKLRRTALAEGLQMADEDSDNVVDDLPPPLDKNDRQDTWRPDWSHRNWPRG